MTAGNFAYILGSGFASTLLFFPVAYLSLTGQFKFKFSNLKILLLFCLSVPLVGILQLALGRGDTDSLFGWFVLFVVPLCICLAVIFAAHRFPLLFIGSSKANDLKPSPLASKNNQPELKSQANALEKYSKLLALNTAFRRASFLIAIFGAIIFALGLTYWLDKNNNTFLWRSASIPDYPVFFIENPIFQINRSCKWADEFPKGQELNYQSGLVANDIQISLDGPCVQERLTPLQLPETMGMQGLRFEIAYGKYSNQLLIRENIDIEGSRHDWYGGSSDPTLSGSKIAKIRWVKQFMKAGISEAKSDEIIDACIKKQPRYCIESSREMRSYVWRTIQSSWTMLTGLMLLLVGLAGSLFLTPLTNFWKVTGARVINWIKSGSI